MDNSNPVINIIVDNDGVNNVELLGYDAEHLGKAKELYQKIQGCIEELNKKIKVCTAGESKA